MNATVLSRKALRLRRSGPASNGSPGRFLEEVMTEGKVDKEQCTENVTIYGLPLAPKATRVRVALGGTRRRKASWTAPLREAGRAPINR